MSFTPTEVVDKAQKNSVASVWLMVVMVNVALSLAHLQKTTSC